MALVVDDRRYRSVVPVVVL